ncbi:D-alanine--D-alanine ligase [Streptomyces sp. Ag109_O5-1]|uniref:D-alanine--D-alanine ligase family protein n=1 Tax=Streptomyces sp. Ag109_O5-1 TaxID=1938851 RepID=UPI000F505B50|nr:D-alanine--D-alanine ligase [Streptomyces sp. Ag109_O5-1]RPE39080.1 D-alanine--D-alanine ligase [Streptomyces sp. Ag109_O5-1]
MTIRLVSQYDYPKGVVVITGGWSAERHRSLLSAQAVLGALHGMGVRADTVDLKTDQRELGGRLDGVDTVFLAIAGRGGEDGRLQGYLETRGIDYTGSGVLASAVCMHKLRAKSIVRAAGVLTTPVATAVSHQVKVDVEAARIVDLLGPDIIIKPVNEGCSVGLRRPRGNDELIAALLDASSTDLMAEAYHRGRSISVGVLEDETTGRLDTLPPIEAETAGRVYTQAAKENSDLCTYRCPAPLTDDVDKAVREQAVAAHRALGCHGYSRHDFIITPDQRALWLEANTLPGLSHKGNLARMAKAAGISYEQLVSHILRGARTDRRAQA